MAYTMTLILHYEDDAMMWRMISGIRQEETLFDIMLEFGSVYFLSNYSIMPITAPSPITTIAVTRMMQLQETMHRFQQVGNVADMVNHDENLIEPKKIDISINMQNDGGPLSFENKGDYFSACAKSSLLMLVACCY